MVGFPALSSRTGAGCPTSLRGTDRYFVHCTNGKDRTGWAVALVLLAVGVDVDDVMTDYLTTNEQLLPVMEGCSPLCVSRALIPRCCCR